MLLRTLVFLAVFTPGLAWDFYHGYRVLVAIDPEGFRSFEIFDPYGLFRLWFLAFGLLSFSVPAALGHLAVVRRDRKRLGGSSR